MNTKPPVQKKKQKPPFLHIEVSEMGRATIPQNNINLYPVSRILVLVIQNDMSTRTKVIAWKQFSLQTDYNAIP